MYICISMCVCQADRQSARQDQTQTDRQRGPDAQADTPTRAKSVRTYSDHVHALDIFFLCFLAFYKSIKFPLYSLTKQTSHISPITPKQRPPDYPPPPPFFLDCPLDSSSQTFKSLALILGAVAICVFLPCPRENTDWPWFGREAITCILFSFFVFFAWSCGCCYFLFVCIFELL